MPGKLNKIGIVIPAYNAEKYLRASVESVRAQTHPDWHCVIIDDGSRDGTSELAGELARGDARITFRSQANAGPSAARNAGFRSLRDVDAVLFHDADDVMEPDLLSTLLAALDRDAQAVAAHALAEYIDADGNPKEAGFFAAYGRDRHGLREGRIRTLGPGDPTTFDTLAVDMRIYPMGIVLIRKSALDAVGLLDTRYKICHDIDLFLRLATRGHFAFVDEALCQYRMHASNISSARSNITREKRQVIANLLKSPLLDADHRKLIAQSIRARNDLKVGMWWNAMRHEIKMASPLKAGKCAAHLAVNIVRSAGSRLQSS
jgi:glycosyltransferase involved in cell wall biosynthesis